MATIMVTGRLEKLIGGLESPSSQLNLDATGSQSPVEFKSCEFNPGSLKDIITNSGKEEQGILTVKVKPILLSFCGQPDSGKTAAIECLRKNFIDKSPFTRVRSKTSTPEAEGITYHEVVAASVSPWKNLSISEVTNESCIAPVILSAFKERFLAQGKVPFLKEATAIFTTNIHEFEHPDLDEHLSFIYQYLYQQKYIAQKPDLSKDEIKKAEDLINSLPEGIAIINVWDVSIDKAIRHFLAALQGHLYNNHIWHFLDLEKDFDNLDKPPEGKLMKWRPRLHYLVRSFLMCKDEMKERRKVCTIIAKHDGTLKSEELQEKVKILEKKVQPVAKHIEVSHLLEKEIGTINMKSHDDLVQLYQMFQLVINKTKYREIPISWVFLRSLFYRFNWKIIARADVVEMARKCHMDEASLKDFCKFYTSFGSIFDLSLINPIYQYIIIKPVDFLKLLDNLLVPSDKFRQEYPMLKYGIVTEDACRQLFDGHISVYIDALVSLNLAVKVARYNLELQHIGNEEMKVAHNALFYYVPLICKDDLVHPDPTSMHLITSIDMPHIFRQVAFTDHFLGLLPQFKLVPSEYHNQTIIRDSSNDITVTLVSHSPAMRLHLSKPDEHVCSCIIQAYEKIAESAREKRATTIEYKFVKICEESNLQAVQSIPLSHYHILPDDKLCTKCNETSTEEDAKLLEVWNKALTEHPIKDYFRSTYGDLKRKEIDNIANDIAKKIASLPSCDVNVIAKAFEYSDSGSLEGSENDFAIGEILFSWYKQNKHIQEPRRVFARKILELGGRISQLCTNEDQQKEVKAAFIRMAKEVDIYFDPET